MFESHQYQYFEDVNWGLLRLWGARSGLDVLDAGCGFATTSQHIQELGNRVTGIESSAEAAAVARTRIGEVIEADLQQVDALAGRRFDVMIFADVLEHLAWPIGILRKYVALLKEGGTVIVSLPNVGLWSVRVGLLLGRFHYEDTGVLDRTHLRFFTRSSAVQMLRAAGLEPLRRTYNPGLIRPFVPLVKRALCGSGFSPTEGAEARPTCDPAAILDSRPYRLYLKSVYPIERGIARLWPGMLAFQMIFEARRT